MRFKLLSLTVALAAAVALFAPAHGAAQQASPSPLPSGAPSPPPVPSPVPGIDDPKIHKLAVQQFLAWQQGQVDRALYSDDVNAQLSPEVLDRATSTLANLGGLQHVAYRGISRTKGIDIHVYRMSCENGAVDMYVATQPDGKIDLIFFE